MITYHLPILLQNLKLILYFFKSKKKKIIKTKPLNLIFPILLYHSNYFINYFNQLIHVSFPHNLQSINIIVLSYLTYEKEKENKK